MPKRASIRDDRIRQILHRRDGNVGFMRRLLERPVAPVDHRRAHGFVIDNPQITGWVEDYVIHINSQMLGYVVAVLLVSLASYHFVERPGIAVGRSLTRNATSHRRAAEAPS